MKKIAKRWSILISLMLVLIMAGNQIFADEISDLNNQKDEIESENQELEASIENVEAYIDEIDGKISVAAAELNETNNKLEKTRDKIKNTKEELKVAEESIQEQYASMKLRIQFMYENGDTQLLDLLLGSKDFSEFINKAEYISELSQYDRDMLMQLKETKQKIANAKTVLEEKEKELVALQTEQEEKMAELESLSAKKETELASYENQIEENEKQLAQIESEIDAMEAKIKETQQGGNIPQASGNGYIWPVPGHTYVSSDYGYRTDPIHGGQQFHTGIDIPAPTGTPVVAAEAGVVVWATYSNSAGNWIGVSHSNGTTTVYMHLSGFAVSTGQTVSAGQTIGYVGSTGWSTGAHLDFSVRINSDSVSPWNYL